MPSRSPTGFGLREGLPAKGRGRLRKAATSHGNGRELQETGSPEFWGSSSPLLFSCSVARAPLLLSEMNLMPVKS